jgi:hypothetical protein
MNRPPTRMLGSLRRPRRGRPGRRCRAWRRAAGTRRCVSQRRTTGTLGTRRHKHSQPPETTRTGWLRNAEYTQWADLDLNQDQTDYEWPPCRGFMPRFPILWSCSSGCFRSVLAGGEPVGNLVERPGCPSSPRALVASAKPNTLSARSSVGDRSGEHQAGERGEDRRADAGGHGEHAVPLTAACGEPPTPSARGCRDASTGGLRVPGAGERPAPRRSPRARWPASSSDSASCAVSYPNMQCTVTGVGGNHPTFVFTVAPSGS